MDDSKQHTHDIERLSEHYVYEVKSVTIPWSDSQNSQGDTLSFSQESDGGNTPSMKKPERFFRLFLIPCLAHQYPNSPLKETKFQNPDLKNCYYLKALDDKEKEERKKSIPEVPDELKSLIRQMTKTMMVRRSSSNTLQIKRSKYSKLEPQKQELELMYSKVIHLFQKKPDVFDKVKSMFQDMLQVLQREVEQVDGDVEVVKQENGSLERSSQ